ncbi:unnamed protein product [Colias eurytheme]|nr:unnamed protein product [Colias eurytheme]
MQDMNTTVKHPYRPKSASLHPPKSRFPSYVVAFSLNETDYNKEFTNTIENHTNICTEVKEIINDIFEKVCEIDNDSKLNNEPSDLQEIRIIINKAEQANEYIMPSNESTDTIKCGINKNNSLEEKVSNITLKNSGIVESNTNDLNNNASSSVTLQSTRNSSIEKFCQINEVNMENDKKSLGPIDSQPNICSDDNKLESGSIQCEDLKNNIKTKHFISVGEELKPYKTDIINVALAQLGSQSIVKDRLASPDTLKENMISTETLVNETIDLKAADTMETKDLVTQIFNEDNFRENSDATLVGSIISEMSSKNEKFFLACTGSCLNKTDESNYTITSCSEYCSSSNTEITEKTSVFVSEDRNKNLANDEPSVSNVEQNKINTNVIIAEGLQKLYPLKNKGDNISLDKFTKNVLKKSLDTENAAIYKNIKLPNEEIIKEIITERDNSQKISCSEESRHFQPFPDLWDKLTVTLDLAIKKLEESLSKKILGELQTTLQKFEHYAHLISKQETKLQKPSNAPDLHKIEIGNLEVNNEEGMQCDIIQSHVIDNLIQNKLSTDDQKSERSSKTKVLNKIKHPKTFKDNFEILKAYIEPVVSKQLGDGDSVKISTEGVSLTTTQARILFRGPLRFLKENYFVLSSVPAFFFCVFLIYGFIVLLIKLW